MDFTDHAVELEYQAILNHVLESIITIDTNGIILSINQAGISMFGYDSNEIIGKNVSMLMTEIHAQAHDRYIANYLQTGVEHVMGKGREVEGKHKSGKILAMQLAVSEVCLPHAHYFVAVCRDISEQKAADQLKNEFISVVSHELRTPLTSISASLGLLKGGIGGELPAKARNLIEIAHNNALRLGRLINDILDIEKIEAGKMRFKRELLDVKQLLEEAIEANLGYANKFQTQLLLTSTTDNFAVIADHDRSLQILANLISNACKFSPANDMVTVSYEQQDERIAIYVRDHGSGISPEFAPYLFNKFSQATNSNVHSKEGSGLGLALARQMARQMGGDISFTSEPNIETTFCLTLPLVQVENTTLQRAQETTATILIVEDDPDIARLLSLLLKEHHLNSHIAYNATQALALLDQNHYAAMTLDLMLPDVDGSQLLAQLRQQAHTKNLPVIVVSAIADSKKDEISTQFAVLDVLPKPIDEHALIQSIRRALGSPKAVHTRARILHIEDDKDIAELFATLLGDNFNYLPVATLAQARQELIEFQPDLILLDLELPDGSGTQLFEDLQKAGLSDRPVVIFSAQEQPQSRLLNLVSRYLVKSRTTNQDLLDILLRLTHNTTSTEAFR
jgi:PAS domain S-box-containing protein